MNSEKKLKVDRTLDCIGLYCPQPVFETRIELDKMSDSEILEVLADDPASEEDIKSLIKNKSPFFILRFSKLYYTLSCRSRFRTLFLTLIQFYLFMYYNL